MSSKSTSSQVDDFAFVMTCLQNSTDPFPKPDFEKVATLIGAKSGNACYHRLWTIKRNWGMTGSKKGPATPTTPMPTGKRGRPAKAKSTLANDENDDFEDTPTKKTKTTNCAQKVKKENAVDGDDEDVSGDTEEFDATESAAAAEEHGDDGSEAEA